MVNEKTEFPHCKAGRIAGVVLSIPLVEFSQPAIVKFEVCGGCK